VIKKAEQTNEDTGVVLCDCGGTLRGRLDFEKLQKHLDQLPSVAKVSCCSKFCQQDECAKVTKFLTKKQVSRVVIAACDTENFDRTLRESMANESLNEGFLWCVNIREHCGWVTSKLKAATDKAIDVLSAAVRRTQLATAVKSKKTSVNQDVLVLGGGVAAMQTAVGLSKLGHQITIINSGEKLGGLAAKMPELYAYVASDSSDAETLVQNRVDELIEQVNNDKQICVVSGATLESVEGEFGNFAGVVKSGASRQTISAGAIVVATGSAPSPLGAQVAKFIRNGEQIPKRIAIVLDVLAEQGRDVSAQVLSAAELLAKRFGAEVKLYCHNIRVAATGLENLYQRAREAGVVVVKYERTPVISKQGTKKIVCAEEPVIGTKICEEFDLVIMADAPAGNGELLEIIEGLQAGVENTLQADNVWFLPTKTNREGIFVAGSARGNSELRAAQTDGLAAANEIHELLKNKQIEVLDDAAAVDADKCVLCLTCMRICPHGAVNIDVENKTAAVSAVSCQRCGVCAAQCPAAAIQLPGYADEQITAEVGDKPRITVFACENSAWPAATAAGSNGSQYSANIRLIRVPCAGKVDLRQVLRALECGAVKVLIMGCHLESCQYLTGSSRAEKRIEHLNNTLEKAGVDRGRVIFGPLASVEPAKFLEYVKE
jgi:heterodisulfide reductase subunit A-like polyferredoxin/coenzyme F420-reducing hydrogenase delta subunit